MNGTVQRTDRTWDVVCHLSALVMFVGVPFGNIIGPLIIWLIKRGDSPSVDEHGKEALNFQISVTLYLIIAAAVTAGLMLILIGFLLLPLLIVAAIAVPVIDLIFIIIAAVKASNGESYRYPLTLRLIR
jgi:uncharacterized Tic20 family protein